MPLIHIENETHKKLGQLALDSEPKRTLRSVTEEALETGIPAMRKRLEVALRAAAEELKRRKKK